MRNTEKDQKGKKPANDPAMAPWNELKEGLKASNRQQAHDIPTKLEALGCDFSPVPGRKIVPHTVFRGGNRAHGRDGT